MCLISLHGIAEVQSNLIICSSPFISNGFLVLVLNKCIFIEMKLFAIVVRGVQYSTEKLTVNRTVHLHTMQYGQKCITAHCVLWAEQFSCTEKHSVHDEYNCYTNICCF